MLPAVALVHGLVLCCAPPAPVIALLFWWNANTISHNFIHRPFFRSHGANAVFGLYLTLVLGIPQRLWRDRHLAHHADRRPCLRLSFELLLHAATMAALWTALALWSPRFLLTTYLPGLLAGLGICAIHGYFEHARGATSHYGRLYNLLFFNDGFHAEHHANPGCHWKRLPFFVDPAARVSPWPAPLRWLPTLDMLERLAMRSPRVRRWLIDVHTRAIRPLVAGLPPVRSVAIVGGGLFPRTALVFRRLLPDARLIIIDADRTHLDCAATLVDGVEFVHARYPDCAVDCDLLVIPLAYAGDRSAIYRNSPARALLVHDWIWRVRGAGHVVSPLLLKRVNLVQPASQADRPPELVRRPALAAALLLVFVLAKAIAVAGYHLAPSGWAPIAYLWQDAAVVLCFATVERFRAGRALYAIAAAYVIANIPVTRALGTPLTPAMLRAAGGPLLDSFRHYATWSNAALVLGVAAIAAAAPRVLRETARAPLIAVLALVVAVGPFAGRRVDSFGLDRNPWTALLAPRLPAPAGDWRITGFEPAASMRTSPLRGRAAGFNIVFISLESTAAQYLGLYGAHPDPMPNLSRLAQNSIVFDNAYAAYPESIKGLFSVICSTWPAFGSNADSYSAVPCRSLAAVVGDAGYRTALFHSGRFMYLGMEAVIRNRGFATLEDAGDIGGNRHSSFGIDEPSTVARALRWIDSLPPAQPFFLAYLPIAGHHPYETPEPGPFPDTTDFDRYRNALHYGDAALGMLIDGIRSRGLEQRTIWIIAGDHGEAFGQHDGNFGHTFQLYEENVHVPLLIAAPGLIGRQVRDPQVASLIDAAPTILALAGIDAPRQYQGRSLLDAPPRMALFFADYSLGLLGLRDGPRKLIFEVGSGRCRYFDLARDPGEQHNLTGADTERLRWYTQTLRNWSAAQQRLLAAAM